MVSLMVPADYTSQRCSFCAFVSGKSRLFICVRCGFRYRADCSAALNIERAGTNAQDIVRMDAEDDYAADHLIGGARLVNRRAWTGMRRSISGTMRVGLYFNPATFRLCWTNPSIMS